MSKQDLSTRRSNLSAPKRALLEKLMRGKAAGAIEARSIPQRPERDLAQLSFSQQRLWFLDQLVPGNPFYIIPAVVRMTGHLDVAALERSLNEVVARHEVLRASFVTIDGQPMQIIAPALNLSISVSNLTGMDDSESEALRLAAREAQQPFDLGQPSLMRVKLLRLAEDEHILLLMMHHIISDEWSIGVLLTEIGVLYEAFTTGRNPALPDLPVQYGDFAAWQQNWLQGEAFQKQLLYWRQQLEGIPPVLDLPTDQPRPPVPSFRGGKQWMSLSPGLTESLRQLSDKQGATLFMTLLATFATLLHRYTGQQDIIVGSPIANRNQGEIKGLIGCFINTLVLRTDLSGNPAFADLLRRVKEIALGAYANQDLPFEKVVEELQAERDLSRNPLFNVMLVFQNVPMPAMELPGLILKPVEVHNDTAKLDLVLSISETAAGLVGYFEYSKDLFNDVTISRMISHFHNLLEAIVANPHQPISTLPLLTELERQTLIDWNNAGANFSRDECLHQLFEMQVERTPDAIAVVFDQDSLTYRELNRRANRFAHRLLKLGVGPELCVAICLERSIEMLVGLLAILKAGAAYVPLDPLYPKERLAYVLDHTRAPILITQRDLIDRLPHHSATVVEMDSERDEVAQESDSNLAHTATAENPAYVIYTSGSTGKPKGVVITHSNVTRLMGATHHWFDFNEGDVWTLFHSYTFDLSVWEMWGALLYGGRLVVVPYMTSRTPEAFYELLVSEKVTMLTQTPSAFRQLMRAEERLDRQKELSLREVIFAGEALELQSLKGWIERHGDEKPRLVNMYGITETTVHVTYRRVMEKDVSSGTGSVIGEAIPDLQMLVLDGQLEPVPIGVAGEIYVGGEGLARGYLNRAELTAERFIPNPYSQKEGARLYKTGDLARYLSNGDMEYLVRADQQVKVRGYRIELGEIEAAIMEHGGIRESVVTTQEEKGGEKRLVAYVVGKEGEELTVSELRGYLKKKLPEYMVPGAYVMMEGLPLTANGKIDRRALPEPDSMRPELSQAFVPPRERKEKLLADIWMEFLGLKQVGIHDNFFELGGDSILSIQVVARANQAGLRLTPRHLFQHQTIAELAAAETTEAIEAEQERVSGEVMLTPIQWWFFEQELADPHHFNQAVLLEAWQALDQAVLREALGHLIDHHDALRLRFGRQAEGWKQTNAEAENNHTLTHFDLSHLTEVEQRLAINTAASDLQVSLNLTEGPLVRATLFDLGGGTPARLLIVIHHLAVDAVSWRILLEDLQTACHQISRGEAIALPPKTTSFKQWALLLNKYAQTDEVKQELGYWMSLLGRQIPTLPVDHHDGANTVASTGVVAVELSRQQTLALLQEVPEAFHTQINEVLLACLARAYSKWSGERELVVDVEGHGREEIVEGVDLTRTVGWFTTIYPVVVEVREGEAATETLKRVKEEVRRIPKRGIGYGVLRYLTGDEEVKRQMGSLPEAEISFNYLGQLDQSIAGSTLFTLGRQPDSPSRSPQGCRAHAIEIDCGVVQGKLNIGFTFSRSLHRQESLEQLAECFTDALNGLVAQRGWQVSTAYSASDFPLAGLDQEKLNRLAASYPQIEDIYPLSPMQQGMLFHSLYEPGSDIYITQMSCELSGELEVEALCWAWQQVIDRHTILRTAFEWEEVDEPLQVIVRRAKLSIEQQDWRGISEDEQRQKLGEYLREGRSEGFDFRQPPLMRVALMRVADNKHCFVWEHHHMLLDGWSTAALMQEVFSLYEGRTRGEQVRLDARRPYRDYIQWVMKQDRSKAQQYWQRELGGVKAAAKLGVEVSGGGSSRQGYTQQTLRLSEQQSEKLNSFARQQQVTLNTILQGCWAVLMSRYSQQQEVIFGVTVSGRGIALEGVEKLIGLMINTLPMRVEVPDNQPVSEWLRAIQQKHVEQREYEYSSLWQVQSWSGAEAGEQLFESILVFENYPVEAGLKKQFEEGAKLAVSNVRSVEETNYGLTMAVLPGKEVIIEIGYERQRYDEAMIRRMQRQMEVLLDAMTADPLQPPSLLPLMSQAERRHILVDFNDTQTPFPADCCIHHLVERQVDQTPDAVAVVCGQQQITYRELNRRANQLARHLRSLSLAPERLVAICLDSSTDLVVSMLASSKAGAAYLPLDRSNPKPRLAFMMEDSAARVVITRSNLLELLPGEVRTICLDTDQEAISRHSSDNLDNLARAANAAYVVYTSGSTGKPKGILIEQRSLVNECIAFATHHELREGDRLLQFASVGFDVAGEEVFSPLVVGATVVVGEENRGEGVEGLMERCQREGVSVMNLPSGYWHEWVRQMGEGEGRMPQRLRLVIVGNERVSAERYEEWREVVGGSVEWKNAYGPTEATITTTIYGGGEEERGGVAIGRPIANAEVYILDERLEPVGVGVVGEMYIGGVGLARCYVGKADMTAERFIPHPFSVRAGARIYRSGDEGRYREDGQIEFIGRKDEQVKVRGYRVELGEVEAALCEHPSVREAVVVAREDERRQTKLVGYIVAGDHTVTAEELKKYIAERLPGYMQPSAVMVIEEVPRTASGKVDRRALPEVEWAAGARREKREPRSEAERQMQSVWMEVLGAEDLGVDDNFFELGGDSILSLQVVARARRIGLRVTPKQVFEHPTVAGLVEVAELADGGGGIEAEQGAVSGKVKLTPIQRWMLELGMAEVNHFNQAVMLEVVGGVRVEEVREVVRELVGHHDALRMRYRKGAEGWEQECEAEEREDVIEEIDLRCVEEGEEREAIKEVGERIQRSLDIVKGPMIRVGVMEVGNRGRKLVLIVIHHLVVDGVSWRVILEDLERGIGQVKRGEGVRFEAKTTSFKQWSQRLVQYARSGELQKESSYWLDRNMRPVKPLPIDHEAEVNDEKSARLVSVSLGEKETRALLQEVPKVYHTQIDEVLVAGLAEALRAWTGEGSVLVDVEGHGREEIFDDVDLTRTVGWFTTIYPVFLEIGETSETGEVLKRVKQQMRTIPRKGIGYGLLRYLSEDEKLKDDLRKMPAAQLSFNYLGQTDQIHNQKAYFRMTNESTGAVVSPKAERKYLIDINAELAGGRLNVYWSYSENVHRRETIERLAENYIQALRRITIHCQSPEAGGYTPSDFPLARLNQEDLRQLEKDYRQIEDIYPLSPMQEGMLFHSLYSPGSDLYFEQFSCRLEGDLDIAAFKQAWQEVVNRHSILRTACVWEGRPEPLQIVLRQITLPCDLQDWRGLSRAEQQRQLENYLESDRNRGFILSKAPLMRLALIRVAADVYHFVWSHHHLLLDGWSTSVVLKEAFTFYDALCQGEEAHFERPRPYRDYIAWLQQQDMDKAEEFWRHTLKGISAPTPLGGDRSAKAASPQGEEYREERAQLSKAMTAALQALARQQQLTLSTIIQGAWALLLRRYSGDDEVVYGAVVSGRPAELDEAEKMVGLFINTLPVRVKVTGEEPVSVWLRKLQEQQAEMRQYDYSPLAAIQGWSEVKRGEQLFESIVVFENYPVDKTLEGGGERLKVDEIRAEERTNYGLTLESSPGEEMRLAIGYDCQRFDEMTIKRMQRQMEVLLDAMTADPLQPPSLLPLMSQAERRHILVDFNDTQTPFPADCCIHHLVERQVDQTPDALAVISGQQVLSYLELNRRANQLARHLRSLSLAPDQLVAICLDSSTDLVVSMLAASKAGVAYLPLDPANPKARLAFMIEDSQACLLITRSSLLDLLPDHLTTICLDTDQEAIGQQSPLNLDNIASAENAVYVVYTSGSTGTPKGIVVEHHSLVNECLAFSTHHGLQAADRLLQFASVGFDVAAEEVFAPLMTGAAIVTAHDKGAESVEGLLERCEQDGVSVMNLPSGYWHEWVRQMGEGEVRMPQRLRLVIVGNERVSVDRYEEWRSIVGGRIEWKNAYGPTEATITTTIYRGKEEEEKGSVPIGRPIANAEVYILDEELRPVPVGVVGEIYIGGAGVARGYLRRAEMTAERFIPNPFSEEGGRLYKTGDQGRYREEGEIEYIGRKDEQVKVRGYRVELGEVEAALCEHDSVKQCVVVAQEDVPGDRRLVAYVVAQDPSAYDSRELRDHLSGALPAYMLPAAFVLLENLPLTPNGKIDRLALPAPAQAGEELQARFVAPRSPVEEVLAEIWAEVLRVDRIGAHDNFFELGGHSLLAMQVVSRVYETFRSKLPLRKMFEEPTVAGLATVLLDSGDGKVIERTAELLLKVARLSNEEAERLLEEKLCQHSNVGAK